MGSLEQVTAAAVDSEGHRTGTLPSVRSQTVSQGEQCLG